MRRLPPPSTLSPYTTLFRSHQPHRVAGLPRADRGAQRLEAVDRHAVHAHEHVAVAQARARSEEHTSELQSLTNLVCRLLLEKKKTAGPQTPPPAAAAGCDSR